jgi:hypothetical protein
MSIYLRSPKAGVPDGIVVLDNVRVVDGLTYIGFEIVNEADGTVVPK